MRFINYSYFVKMTDQNALDSNGNLLFPVSRFNRLNFNPDPSKSIADVIEEAKLFASQGDDAVAYRWLFVYMLHASVEIRMSASSTFRISSITWLHWTTLRRS